MDLPPSEVGITETDDTITKTETDTTETETEMITDVWWLSCVRLCVSPPTPLSLSHTQDLYSGPGGGREVHQDGGCRHAGEGGRQYQHLPAHPQQVHRGHETQPEQTVGIYTSGRLQQSKVVLRVFWSGAMPLYFLFCLRLFFFFVSTGGKKHKMKYP